MNATIIRVESHPEDGCFSVFLINGEAFCVCLEPPDLWNTPYISAIPEGQYICKAYKSTRWGDTFRVENVPQRTSIIFHPGNTVFSDSKGCPLLGEGFGLLGKRRAILDSRKAFNRFIERMNGIKEFKLTIRNSY